MFRQRPRDPARLIFGRCLRKHFEAAVMACRSPVAGLPVALNAEAGSPLSRPAGCIITSTFVGDGDPQQGSGIFVVYQAEASPDFVLGAELPVQASYPEFEASAQAFFDESEAAWAASAGLPGPRPLSATHFDLARRLLPLTGSAPLPEALRPFASKSIGVLSDSDFQALPFLDAARSAPEFAVFAIYWVHKSLLSDFAHSLQGLPFPARLGSVLSAIQPRIGRLIGGVYFCHSGPPLTPPALPPPPPCDERAFVEARDAFCEKTRAARASSPSAVPFLHKAALFLLECGPLVAALPPGYAPLPGADSVSPGSLTIAVLSKAAVVAGGLESHLDPGPRDCPIQ